MTVTNTSLTFAMDIKTLDAADVVTLSRGLPETTHNDETQRASPMTIKERIALLNGAFPMDDAVVRGMNSPFAYPIFENFTVSVRLTHPDFDYLVLPEGSSFLSVEHFGTSNYGITGKVLARNPDGIESVYFIKVSPRL